MQGDAIKRLQEFAEKHKQTRGKFTIGDEKVRQLHQHHDNNEFARSIIEILFSLNLHMALPYCSKCLYGCSHGFHYLAVAIYTRALLREFMKLVLLIADTPLAATQCVHACGRPRRSESCGQGRRRKRDGRFERDEEQYVANLYKRCFVCV